MDLFSFFSKRKGFLNTHDSPYYLTVLAILALLTIATFPPKP